MLSLTRICENHLFGEELTKTQIERQRNSKKHDRKRLSIFVTSSFSAAGHNCVGNITQNFQPTNHGRAEFENSSFTFELFIAIKYVKIGLVLTLEFTALPW